ncbi:MAG: amidohydrolase [Thermotogae bacterium]|jgi:predicted TIM-barrel fold metal-dependent hydrolase|nr:amidohydrolase [Thermotogota bacterium]MCL5032909.1 amidohydrolase [Thermotogota bacterium]
MKIINAHVHFENISFIDEAKMTFQLLGFEKLNLLNPPLLRGTNTNPPAICFKAKHPKDTYISGGLDYSEIKGKENKEIEHLFLEQLLKLEKIGFDGIKILETKPNDKIYLCARDIPFPIDSQIYMSFFNHIEKNQIPIFWHVADPAKFWDKKWFEGLPSDMRNHIKNEREWDYTDDSYPSKEEFHQKVGNILERFPQLKVVFAHFYFLSSDLERLSSLLDKCPNVNLDLTPNSEIYSDLSKNYEKARDFFIKYQDRILYGDDALVANNISVDNVALIRGFLETDKEFDNFMGEQDKVRGLKLPESVLKKIYSQNFLRIVGKKPKTLNIDLAKEECHRIGRVLEIKYNFSMAKNFGYQAEEFLKNIDMEAS